LRELKLPQGRLKTGTPPRLDGKTINFDVLEVQPGDDPVPVFSFMGNRDMHPRQLPCWVTHTNEQTHDIIRSGLDRSPMFTGVIEGWVRVTARRSKTRSTVSPTRTATRSSSSRKG